jgi:hypothetical protein
VAAPISVTGTPGATTGQPGTSGPPAPSTAPGTLTVSASVVTLRRHGKDGRPAGWFTLTASGGPVSVFTVTVPDAYAGELTVTPATGSLASGRSVIVRVTLLGGGKAPLDAQLSVAPGSLIVTVSYRPPHD